MAYDVNGVEIFDGDMVSFQGQLGKVRGEGTTAEVLWIECGPGGSGVYCDATALRVIEDPTWGDRQELERAGVDWDPSMRAKGPSFRGHRPQATPVGVAGALLRRMDAKMDFAGDEAALAAVDHLRAEVKAGKVTAEAAWAVFDDAESLIGDCDDDRLHDLCDELMELLPRPSTTMRPG